MINKIDKSLVIPTKKRRRKLTKLEMKMGNESQIVIKLNAVTQIDKRRK